MEESNSMSLSTTLKEFSATYATATANLTQPLFLEQDGRPVAVVLSVQEFERYQTLLATRQFISSTEARRIAERALFGELVGCALSSGDPVWVPQPNPHWRIPYRLFDGRLITIVHVDAYTATAALTAVERNALLEKIEQLTDTANVFA